MKNNYTKLIILLGFIVMFLGVVNPSSVMAAGSCGGYDVRAIQTIVGVKNDGFCGPDTIAGIQQYQRDHSLNDDGIVGPMTARAMGLDAGSSSPAADTTTTPAPANSGSGSNPFCDTSAGYSMKDGLCLPNSPFNGGLAKETTLGGLIKTVLTILLTLSGIIAVVFIIIGGFQYMTAGGNEEQAEKGRKALVNAIIGLVVVILAFTIVTVVTNFVTSGNL